MAKKDYKETVNGSKKFQNHCHLQQCSIATVYSDMSSMTTVGLLWPQCREMQKNQRLSAVDSLAIRIKMQGYKELRGAMRLVRLLWSDAPIDPLHRVATFCIGLSSTILIHEIRLCCALLHYAMPPNSSYRWVLKPNSHFMAEWLWATSTLRHNSPCTIEFRSHNGRWGI